MDTAGTAVGSFEAPFAAAFAAILRFMAPRIRNSIFVVAAVSSADRLGAISAGGAAASAVFAWRFLRTSSLAALALCAVCMRLAAWCCSAEGPSESPSPKGAGGGGRTRAAAASDETGTAATGIDVSIEDAAACGVLEAADTLASIEATASNFCFPLRFSCTACLAARPRCRFCILRAAACCSDDGPSESSLENGAGGGGRMLGETMMMEPRCVARFTSLREARGVVVVELDCDTDSDAGMDCAMVCSSLTASAACSLSNIDFRLISLLRLRPRWPRVTACYCDGCCNLLILLIQWMQLP